MENYLSTHFSLPELLESQSARRLNIPEQFTPSDEVIENLKELCNHILEPLRITLGVPIHISSGYRCARTNKAVGGQPTSQHQVGQAADIQCPSLSNADLFEKIRQLNLPFDQLIWEFGNDKNPAWVHVSYGPRKRKMVFAIGVNKSFD